jgi:hypothetical protein
MAPILILLLGAFGPKTAAGTMVGKPTVARVAPMAPFTEVFMKSLLFGFLFSSMANIFFKVIIYLIGILFYLKIISLNSITFKNKTIYL